jgi:hypothetical protein
MAVLLATGDAIALLAFLLLGEIQHDLIGSPELVPDLLKQFVAIGAAWFTLAWALGALGMGQPPNWRAFLGRSTLAWLFAAPAGIVLRAVALGQAAIVMPFVFAAIGFGGLILLAWRAIYALARTLIDRRRQRLSPATTQAR